MIQKTVIEHSTTQAEFISSVADELYHKYLKTYLEQLHKSNPEPRYYSRAETAKILGIALSTLHEYTKDGLIKSSRLSGRVLFSDADIQNALTK